MTYQEFLTRYSNILIADRSKKIITPTGEFTLLEIYQQCSDIEDYIRPYLIQQKQLMDIADKHMRL